MEKPKLTCSRCPFETTEFIELVKHLRAIHGLPLNEAMAEAERRKPQKTLADAVREHNRLYGMV